MNCCCVHVLDTARVNASVIYAVSQKIHITKATKLDSYQFGFDLADSLVSPYICRRSLNGLSNIIILIMSLFLGEKVTRENEAVHIRAVNVQHSYYADTETKCTGFKSELTGQDGKEDEPTKRQKKDHLPKIKLRCQSCAKILCNKYLLHFCKKIFREGEWQLSSNVDLFTCMHKGIFKLIYESPEY